MTIAKRWILTLALLSYLIIAIDASIVFTGLTEISEDLHLNQIALSWVQNAYVIAFGGFLLLGGRLGDAYGRRKTIDISLWLFGIGSIGSGMAICDHFIIVSRFIQGIGAAMIAPASLALIMDNFQGQERVKAIAWYSSVSGLGMCFGLILGGAVTDYLTWRVGFLLNIPLVGWMLWISANYIAKTKGDKRHFDWWGTGLSIFGILLTTYAIDGADNFWPFFIGGVALLIVFIYVEYRIAYPIMPLSLFKSPIRSSAYVARFTLIGAMMGFNFFISEYMQKVLQYNPLQSGLGFIPMTLFTFIAAMCVPRWIDMYGNRKVLLFGLMIMIVGFMGFLMLGDNGKYLVGIGIPMLFIGFGLGLAMSPTTNLGIQAVAPDNAGAASGVVNTAHQIGGAVGLAVMIALGKRYTDFIGQFHIAMIVCLICVICSLTVSIWKYNR